MSQLIRHSNLLYGSDWKKVFTQFPQINYYATDFDTYREAFIDYIRINYPENFNDWVENSELIFLIDLLAYYGANLTFKTELNAQDNFIDTASTKDSIINLARLVNYNPSRNYPARGLAKITEITTTQELYDSNGQNIQNTPIRWNDPSNSDWFEQFILILNNTFNKTNPFGLPVKSGSINNILTQLYQLNSVNFSKISYPFNASINNENLTFEVVNPDFKNNEVFYERTPNPENSFNLIYKNDGAGHSSIDNGFFVYFKQGSLSYIDYNFSNAVENRRIDINTNNINELDVWVQHINENNGSVLNEWTRVPTTENIIYNSLSNQEKNIFSVKTRENDKITIQFPDGTFGNVPIGIFRLWYRTSINKRYSIRSQDIKNITITIPYKINQNDDQTYNLTIKFSLQYNIQNSIPSEDEDQIKIKAPQNFLIQDRAISGDDYNTFPLLAGNLVRKSKAINRTFSGHNRFIDNIDPTGNYQNSKIFSNDGIIYTQENDINLTESLPTNKTALDIITSKIYPLINNKDLINFYYKHFPKFNWIYNDVKVKWLNISNNINYSSGLFVDSTNADTPLLIGQNGLGNANLIKEGSLIRLVNDPNLTPNDPMYKEIWVNIQNITDYPNNINGPVKLSQKIDSNETWYVDIFYTVFNTTLKPNTIEEISSKIEERLTFGIRYDYFKSEWKIVNVEDMSETDFSLSNQGDQTQQNLDASSIIKCYYSTTNWSFKLYTTEYIFESEKDVRFYVNNNQMTFDINTGQPVRDFIDILKINTKHNINEQLNTNYKWFISDKITYNDGFTEPIRIKITMGDANFDGIPDNPIMFEELVNNYTSPTPTENSFIFYKKEFSEIENYVYNITNEVKIVQIMGDISGDGIYYIINEDKFINVINSIIYNLHQNEYIYKIGRKLLIYNWQHFANIQKRIDPSVTNINDIYVLTEEYYQNILRWLNNKNQPFPITPTTEDLRITFQPFIHKKAASDTIIWHPVKFKLLFGDTAHPQLQAKFKIIKSDSTTITDNEIKFKVIQAVNTFFDIKYWDFGETFNYTELSTFIHNQLKTDIVQCLIVPEFSNYKFGELFQIRCEYNELFLSTANVNNIEIIDSITTFNIKIGE